MVYSRNHRIGKGAPIGLPPYIGEIPQRTAQLRRPLDFTMISDHSEYFGENTHLFDALDFVAELTQHIPPRRVQLIRRYGLYLSRIKGRWTRMPHVAARAPEGWRASHLPEVSDDDDPGFEPLGDGEEVTVNPGK